LIDATKPEKDQVPSAPEELLATSSAAEVQIALQLELHGILGQIVALEGEIAALAQPAMNSL